MKNEVDKLNERLKERIERIFEEETLFTIGGQALPGEGEPYWDGAYILSDGGDHMIIIGAGDSFLAPYLKQDRRELDEFITNQLDNNYNIIESLKDDGTHWTVEEIEKSWVIETILESDFLEEFYMWHQENGPEATLRKLHNLRDGLSPMGYDLDYNPNETDEYTEDDDSKPWNFGPLGPWEDDEDPKILAEARTYDEIKWKISDLGIDDLSYFDIILMERGVYRAKNQN